MNTPMNIKQHLEKPSETEIAKAINDIQEKHGVTLSGTDAERYLMLRAELGWWIDISESPEGMSPITEEMAKALQAHVKVQSGEDITLEEAYKRAKASYEASAESEKERIAGEIRQLIGEDRRQS